MPEPEVLKSFHPSISLISPPTRVKKARPRPGELSAFTSTPLQVLEIIVPQVLLYSQRCSVSGSLWSRCPPWRAVFLRINREGSCPSLRTIRARNTEVEERAWPTFSTKWITPAFSMWNWGARNPRSSWFGAAKLLGTSLMGKLR